MKQNKKFVVLEHILLPDRGFRFWSVNTSNNTKLFDGTVAYKEVITTDSAEEAIGESQKTNTEVLPTTSELYRYYKENNCR